MNCTPRTADALAATMDAGFDLGEQHRALTDLCRELERETNKLRGERRVFAELFDAAARVIHTLDGDDTDEEDRLRELQERLELASLEARGLTVMAEVPETTT